MVSCGVSWPIELNKAKFINITVPTTEKIFTFRVLAGLLKKPSIANAKILYITTPIKRKGIRIMARLTSLGLVNKRKNIKTDNETKTAAILLDAIYT